MLRTENLRVSYGTQAVLTGIDLQVETGESLAIIGESGAGKTTFGLSIMGLVEGSVRGHVYLDGVDLVGLPEDTMRGIRWNRVSMVFQNADGVLNPVHTIMAQVMEPMTAHGLRNKREARERAAELLSQVGLSQDRFSAYPHELSGGEQQRGLIAMALANDAELVILDEPLSSLDAGSKAEITSLLNRLRQDHTLVIATHDLSTVAKLADKMATMYAGRIVELGATAEILSRPMHPYTRALLRSYPNMTTVKDLQGIKGRMERGVPGCAFYPRCTQAIEVCRQDTPLLAPVAGRQLACHRGGVITLLETRGLSKSFGKLKAVDSVSLRIQGGETLALVGESGSGKTTLAKTIVGILKADSGDVLLEDKAISQRDAAFYSDVQMVFQNPGEALSHRLTVMELIREPLDIHGVGTRQERESKVKRVAEEVELPVTDQFLNTYPHHLSGGELQRVNIGRALVLDPRLLIADEPTAFLDPSLKAKIMKLLLNLQEQRGLSLLFITHDIALARKVSDRIAVMQQGKIVEEGPSNVIITSPVHQYTRTLIDTASDLQPQESDTNEEAIARRLFA